MDARLIATSIDRDRAVHVMCTLTRMRKTMPLVLLNIQVPISLGLIIWIIKNNNCYEVGIGCKFSALEPKFI